jgi:hypothetical protein
MTDCPIFKFLDLNHFEMLCEIGDEVYPFSGNSSK